MRKVKFRGWAEDCKEWIYGAWQSSTPDKLFDTHPHNLPFETVNPQSVGQYTEMSDAKGKKIFEGDLLENQTKEGNYRRGKVAFFNGRWNIEYLDGGYAELYWALKGGEFIVVGNAFEKPQKT